MHALPPLGALLVLLSGCSSGIQLVDVCPSTATGSSACGVADDGSPGPFLVLNVTYIRGSDSYGSFDGNHCGYANAYHGRVSLDRDYQARLGEGPTLIVQPRLVGAWSTTGTGGYPLRLDADVATHVEGDAGTWARLAWVDYPQVGVDGVVHALPYSWATQRDGYEIEATISLGPAAYVWDHVEMCI